MHSSSKVENKGTFEGLVEKLPYLKELGINTIWITPVVENITADMQAKGTNGEAISSYGYTGYWASNFEKLNAHLGTFLQNYPYYVHHSLSDLILRLP